MTNVKDLGETILRKREKGRLRSGVGRLGLGARAVVYAVISYLAFDIAIFRTAPTQTNGQGALAEVARQPAGSELLGVLATGLLAYALWRLMGALAPDGSGTVTGWKRAGWLAAAVVYVGLFAQALRIVMDGQGSGGPTNHPRPYVATVLHWPGGSIWVGLAGFAVVAAGIALAAWGLVHDFRSELTTGHLDHSGQVIAQATGALGNLTRGLLVLLFGAYLVVAAVTDNPTTVKSPDLLLLTATNRPFGPLLIGLVALGLLAFCVFSLFEARFRAL
jgi:hypothetical protein